MNHKPNPVITLTLAEYTPARVAGLYGVPVISEEVKRSLDLKRYHQLHMSLKIWRAIPH